MNRIVANVERFSGFADVYDRYRPTPPTALVGLLLQLAQTERPALIVDVGSGTGLSTLIWNGRADQVLGIEPNDDMRRQAEARATERGAQPFVSFLSGTSSATSLEDGVADIVTVSQALHWMEPTSTFAEIARILRPGGVFAAYDCDWPPTAQWEAEAAYNAVIARANALEQEYHTAREVRHWNKAEHLQRIRESGHFRYTREVLMHHIEQGGAERLVGLVRSQGGIASLQKAGISDDAIGITALQETLERVFHHQSIPWYWSYRVRIGIK